MKRIYSLLLLSLLFSFGASYAAEPAGYYKTAEGLKDKALLQQLCDIVGPHTNIGYKGIWGMYKDSDIVPGTTNQIWDMYSTAVFKYGTDQCGNYSTVGSCYNREHSFPKSWFDDREPMHSDGYHLYPTDGYVNNQRGNYPFGECANGTYLSGAGGKGLGKLGKSTFPGYSGDVWEPDDQYKGDFARTYFYMAACYNDKFATFNSPMLAGNDYPCYKQWAIDLLIKWHRQDPVSEKEINRNEAVSKYQKNRNPFIDHPELAEFIWGDKKGTPWTPGGISVPTIVTPGNGTTIDMGICSVNEPLTETVTVKAVNLTKDVTVTVAGTSFSVNAATLTAAQANAGQSIVITYSSAADATAQGTLTIASDEAKSVVTLKAQAVSTIPAKAAGNITHESFDARWEDVHKDGGMYEVNVYNSGKQLLEGYPVSVAASLGTLAVKNLEANSTYYYTISRGDLVSNEIEVTTGDYPRSISGYIEGSALAFFALPNAACDPIAVDIFGEYIEENITVDVTGEFEISTDKTNWSKLLSIDKEGERIYVRMKTGTIGEYEGSLSAYTSTVDGFEFDVYGSIAEALPFFEDFEPACVNTSGYNAEPIVYQGSACKWNFQYTGIYTGDSNDKKNGNQSARIKKDDPLDITFEMAEDKQAGAGVVTFMAAYYSGDGDYGDLNAVSLHYSTDQGKTWTKVGSYDVNSKTLVQYSATINVAGPVRIKFEKEFGKRINIDDITISNFSSEGGVDENVADKSWDAYAVGGYIVIETAEEALINIYNLEAETVYSGIATNGTKVELPAGVYVVVNGDNSRKVIVK